MKISAGTIALILAVLAAIILLVIQQSQARELRRARQNMAALQDSARIVTTKNGELETARLALIGDKSTLEQLNKDLAEELKKEKGKVKFIERIKTVIQHDTLEVATQVTVFPDSTYRLAWKHEDAPRGGMRKLAGNTTFRFANKAIADPRTQITQDELSLTLITGLREREEDKLLEIFVRTDYPGVSFPDIQGAVVDPKMFDAGRGSKWSIGPVFSLGLNQELKLGGHLGVGLQYSLLSF